MKDFILVTGAQGQVGSELVTALQNIYGEGQVLASDIRQTENSFGQFEVLDVTDKQQLTHILQNYPITQIYHLAAILSAKGEKNPLWAWQINMQGLLNVLEASQNFNLTKVYIPSSIAVFGEDTPKLNTPQQTIMNPNTVYGISKIAGEQWTAYYHQKYRLDVRGLRYPGLISYKTAPGGGTTDYAVDIFHQAIEKGSYTCFLSENTSLPMMYMDDAIRATLELMHADSQNITVRTAYNLSAMSFSPIELVTEIQKYLPSFKVQFSPDERQAIADSWTQSIDDSAARRDWGWKPEFDLQRMVITMLENLQREETILVS